MEKPFFCSWSGGKDSCLACWKAKQEGYTPKALVTMMTEDPERSRSHGLRRKLLVKQANHMDLPLVMKSTSWKDYETNFIELLEHLRKQGIDTGVYGDIDLQPHLDWIAKVNGLTGVKYLEPLWQMEREEVVRQFLEFGFKAKIVAIKAGTVPEKYLGADLTMDLAREFRKTGIDPAGEVGEFHTFVYAGPLFKNEISFNALDMTERDGYLFLDIE